MGRDKAALPYRGATLAEAVAVTLRGVTGRVTLVGGRRREGLSEFGFVPDLFPGEGPLGGILSALRDSRADWNLIVACDMPDLDSGFLDRLLSTAEDSDGDAVIPIHSGQSEPLCAAYRRSCYLPLSQAFSRGIRKIATALREVHRIDWPVPEELSCFQNVNTPEDWSPYEQPQ
jgi:molybdopterin-guanine dinucleotide biosynthesis protein A